MKRTSSPFLTPLVPVAVLAAALGCSVAADDPEPRAAVTSTAPSSGGPDGLDTLESAEPVGAATVVSNQAPSPLPSGSAPKLTPRWVAPKPNTVTAIPRGHRTDMLVLKFREGARVRRKGGRFVIDAATRDAEDDRRLAAASLTLQQAELGVQQANAILAREPRAVTRPMIRRPARAVEAERRASEAATGEELADLNSYFYVLLKDGQSADVLPLLQGLVGLDVVETVYAQPMGQNAAADLPPTTASFDGDQGWLGAAPSGVDARYLWNRPGGAGDGVKIVDVETAWLLEHEDLNGIFYRSGSWAPVAEAWDHGTAVLGVLGADRNAFGVTGAAHRAQLGVSSPYLRGVFSWWDPAGAIDDAAHNVAAGDVVLIEQHYPGPDGGRSCDAACGNCGQFAYVAVENGQAEFDVIRAATARGVIVVEAAGNGQMDLDGAQFEGRFQRSVRDSGAILVGAGTSWSHAPWCWSNAGTRVDVHAWGDGVMTTGYGDVRAGGDDSKQFYTRGFSGTSSASAIVAGATAALQGARIGSGMPRLLPSSMRKLLVDTGTPQAASPRNIGPQPDLRTAYRQMPIGFTHSASASSVGGHITTLSHPVLDGNPDARLVVTPRWNLTPGSSGVYDDHPIGVWYDGARWTIYHEDGAPMPLGASFDVTAGDGFTAVASASNLSAGRLVLSHASLNAQPGAVVLLTHDYGSSGPYVTAPLVARYDGSRWVVAQRNGAAVTAGTKVNVVPFPAVLPITTRHVTSASNTSGHVTYLPNPTLGLPLTLRRVFATPTDADGTPLPGGPIGVWFTGNATNPVALFDEGFRSLPLGASFSVLYQY